MKLKKINETFKKNGYFYKLVTRKDDLALYSQRRTLTSGVVGYEIHKVRVTPLRGFLIESSTYKGYTHFEKLASNEDFGNYGWYFPNIDNLTESFPEFKGVKIE